jgi:hypothetical protein
MGLIQKQLTRLFVHFPQGRTLDCLGVIAPDYYKAFKNYFEDDFNEAVERAINERDFFPSINQLTALIKEDTYCFEMPSALDEIREMEKEERKPMRPEDKKKLDALLKKLETEPW